MSRSFERLLDLYDVIALVHVHNAGAVFGNFCRFEAGIGQNDYQIAGGPPPSCRSVELDRSRSWPSSNDVCLQARPVVHIDDVNLLKGSDLRCFHQRGIQRQASFVMQVSRRHASAMDLGL